LGVGVESLRSRGTTDGWIAGETFAELAQVEPTTIERWRMAGLLDASRIEETGRSAYLASELVRALLSASKTGPSGELAGEMPPLSRLGG
jgi:hypothetical protein